MLLSRRAFLLAATGDVFLKSPAEGSAVMAFAFYTSRDKDSLLSIEQRWSRSDTIDLAFRRTSQDNGKTWSEPEQYRTLEKRENGTWRRHPRGVWVDPHNGKAVELTVEGVLPTDDPLEGMKQWQIFYSVNGGPKQQIVCKGYEPDFPMPGVTRGKNCAMLGDLGSRPLSMPDKTFLLPVDLTVLSPEGGLYNPGGGYTWHDTAVLRGRWKGNNVEWDMSKPLKGDPNRTTRGLTESTIAALSKTHLILVSRGSNDRKPDVPSYRWISHSKDGGYTWSEPAPWTYSNGENFFSPSSCSQLLEHSNGKLYWLGNVSKTNPRGNRPRYPFHIGEVDRATGGLIKDSLKVIDDLKPGEDPLLTLSNFYAREDRRTQEICLHVTRLFALQSGWKGDAMLYRIAPY